MKRQAFTLVELLVVVVIILILAAFLFPLVGGRGNRSARRSVCQSNLKQIALCHHQYLQDYDERLLLISAGDQGWANSIQPYVKNWQLFQCPSANNPTDKPSSDYFLNARIAGHEMKRIPFATSTILFGEGTDNGATNSHFSELPLNWKTGDDTPAKRHLDGANYAFVDGHVKWFKPEKISTQSPSKKSLISTFAIK